MFMAKFFNNFKWIFFDKLSLPLVIKTQIVSDRELFDVFGKISLEILRKYRMFSLNRIIY
jgi:hypothetical protein